MSSQERLKAASLYHEIDRTLGMLRQIEQRLADHAVHLGMLAEDYEARLNARPLIEGSHRVVVPLHRPNRHFDCPEWPGCGCPDGSVRPGCPGLDNCAGGGNACES